MISEFNVKHLKIGTPLFYSNVETFKEFVRSLETGDSPGKPCNNLHAIIIDFSCMSTIDSTSIHAIAELVNCFIKEQVLVFFLGCSPKLSDDFQKSLLFTKLDESCFFEDIRDAVYYAERMWQSQRGTLQHFCVEKE